LRRFALTLRALTLRTHKKSVRRTIGANQAGFRD
jgi:hypothetical protein